MEIIHKIQSWSIEKKAFVGLASATVIVGASYGIARLVNYISSRPKKKKK